MKYPRAEVKLHKTKKNIVFLHLHLQEGALVCIPIKDDRDIIRNILNPMHKKSVCIYTRRIKDQWGYSTIEKLEYQDHYLYYCNQSITWKIPFTEANRQLLQTYDYQLETHYQDEMCCVLY